MKTLCLWLQRLCILGFLLFAWYIAPFSRFTPPFAAIWSLLVAAAGLVLPGRGRQNPAVAGQAVLSGLLLGLVLGSADWSVLDQTLLFELNWALLPLFLLVDPFSGPGSR
ncbi:MAG: hypothetical protein ACOY93_23615 [Bacillota bacterium]